MLRWFDTVHEEVGWREPVDVYLAIVFHDAVYDPARHDNEAKSAELAKELAGASDRAAELILLTAKHGTLTEVSDHDAAHFLDCDVSILGASERVFDAYDAAVAVEYKHVPADAYRAGRRAFLESMLAKPRIYFSDFFHARLDEQARANLRRALARL
jgi:predicted metal-dependent HD superfamily phosphohydrolase